MEWTPLIVIIVLAGLLAVPVDIIEAAEIDGAGYFARLRHIILPYVALLIRSMDAIRFFDSILVTTNGGPADTTKVVAIRLSASSASATPPSASRCWCSPSCSPTSFWR